MARLLVHECVQVLCRDLGIRDVSDKLVAEALINPVYVLCLWIMLPPLVLIALTLAAGPASVTIMFPREPFQQLPKLLSLVRRRQLAIAMVKVVAVCVAVGGMAVAVAVAMAVAGAVVER